MSAKKISPEEIFHKAIEISNQAELAAYMDEACGDDDKLRAEVEFLLKSHEEAGDFLEAPAIDPNVTIDESPLTEGPETVIGRYKLLEKIGEGGMATVYMAEQKHPIRRRVALKLIKLGMDSKQVIARFEAERQALALMDHPNIAKVLDAGMTETGRPYFVMELVRGVSITEYCDKNHLSTKERLGLFVSVCQAVHHAHQKGIIHRDIKPSNIMVTLHDGEPVVKVIDFGISKAVNQQLTEKTVFTRYSQMIGTPEYMSPEQAEMSGLDIDTRTDVFSLGVLLYELLTGSTPFDAEYLLSKGYSEMQRIIREEEPIRPSTKISTLGDSVTDVAKHRKTSPELLCKLIRTDLDWIVMKTLEKDRQRRYESVSEIAADIKRHLNHEPVLAGRPSKIYRVQKFIKRNKVFVISVATVTTVVTLATILSFILAFTATKAKEDAEQARNAEQQQKVAFQEEAKRATEAEQREGQLRLAAEEQEQAARRRAYAADMLLCQQALADNNLRRARQLLDRQRPKDGQEDLRGWEWRYLWGCCRGDAILRLNLPGVYLTGAVLTNNDQSVVTFAVGGKVSLRDLHTGEDITLQEPRGWRGGSGHLCLSVDGQWIVWHYLDEAEEQTVRIWDTSSHQIVAELPIGKVGIRCLAISPDKRTLAILSPHKGVSLWDIATREKRWHIPLTLAEYMWGNALCYSPSGEVLAFSDNHGKVRLVDAETGEEKIAFSVGSDEGVSVLSLAFSPNGRFLAAGTGYMGPSLSIWDTELNMRVTTLIEHTGFVSRLSFSPDGQHLASASGDQTIKLWNTKDWSEETTLLGHTDEVWSVEFSRDGKHLVSCGKDGNICLWDSSIPNDSRGSKALPAGIKQVDVSPDGKTIVGVSSDGQVQLLDAKTLQVKVVPKSLGDDNMAAFWVSEDNILIGSLNPPQIKALDLSTNMLSTFELGLRETEPLYEDDPMFAYFPSCRILSVVGCDPNFERLTIKRWDVSAHKELSSCTLDEDVSTIREVVISQDAQWMAVSRRNRVEIRDLSTGRKVSNFGATKWNNQGIALSADGQLVATAQTGTPTVHIYDTRSQEEVISLKGHNLVLATMEFSPDGQRLATSTIGIEPVKLWDTESWEELFNLDGRPGFPLLWFQFLSNGNSIVGWETDIATYSINGRLWQAPSWEEIEAVESVENVKR